MELYSQVISPTAGSAKVVRKGKAGLTSTEKRVQELNEMINKKLHKSGCKTGAAAHNSTITTITSTINTGPI